MLGKLDSVDWHLLNSAYGTAADVPDRLRRLTSQHADERERALEDLYDRLFHQESNLYEATAYAVPFLLELLESEDVAGKLAILSFLVGVGDRIHTEIRCKGLDTIRTYPPWSQRLVEALAAGKPVYLRCLKDDDPAMRDKAGYMLGLFKRASLSGSLDGIAAAIWIRLAAERDERVQSGLLLAFGSLCDINEINRNRLLSYLTETNSKSVRLASALALMRLMPEDPDPRAHAILIEAVESPTGYSSPANSIWSQGLDYLWGGELNGLDDLVVEHLLFLAPKPANVVEEALAKMAAGQPLEKALRIARVLLAMAFRERTRERTTFSSLTIQQQRVVKLIAANDCFWIRTGEDIRTVSLPFLGAYGLPYTAAELRSFVKEESKISGGYGRK